MLGRITAVLTSADVFAIVAVALFALIVFVILILTRRDVRSWRVGVFFESRQNGKRIDRDGISGVPSDNEDEATGN